MNLLGTKSVCDRLIHVFIVCSVTRIISFVRGSLPQNLLTILRDSWNNTKEMPLHLGTKPPDYLGKQKQNLEIAKRFTERAGDHTGRDDFFSVNDECGSITLRITMVSFVWR